MWVHAIHVKEDETTEEVHIMDIKCKDADMSDHIVIYAIDATGEICLDNGIADFVSRE